MDRLDPDTDYAYDRLNIAHADQLIKTPKSRTAPSPVKLGDCPGCGKIVFDGDDVACLFGEWYHEACEPIAGQADDVDFDGGRE